MSEYYNRGGSPATNSSLSSAVIRAEFDAIAAGFDKLPTLTGNALKNVRVNAAGDGLETVAGSSFDMGSATNAATSKTTPIDTDEMPLSDSAAAYGLKKLTWANLKATLKTYLDTLYQPASANLTEYATVNPSAFALTILDDADATTARATLGLTLGTSAGNVVALDGSAKLPAVDGSQLTGISAAGGGFKNRVINGAFDVWQRGTSFASTGSAVYTADRWYQFSVTGATVTRVAASSTDAQYGLKLQRNAAQTWTSGNVLEQPYETGDIIKLRGQVVTLSVWIKKGADLSSSASLGVVLKCGTGAEGKYNAASFTGASDVISQTVSGATLSTTLTKYTYTSTAIPTNATQMALYFSLAHSGTAGADDSITLEKVQLEVSSSASAFEQRPYGLELALCQRYYEKSYNDATAPGTATSAGEVFFMGNTSAAVQMQREVPFKVTKRANPTTLTMYDSAGNVGKYSNITTSGGGRTTNATPQAASAACNSWIMTSDSATAKYGFAVNWTADSEL